MLTQLYSPTTEAVLHGIKAHAVARTSQEACSDVPGSRLEPRFGAKAVFRYQLPPTGCGILVRFLSVSDPIASFAKNDKKTSFTGVP